MTTEQAKSQYCNAGDFVIGACLSPLRVCERPFSSLFPWTCIFGHIQGHDNHQHYQYGHCREHDGSHSG